MEENQYLAVITFNVNDTPKMFEIIKEINKKVSYKVEGEDIVIRYTDFETLKEINPV